MSDSVDILIIGAGPAGAMAAMAARKVAPKLSVLVVDKDMGPRHRIGEIFLTQTIIEFHRLGLAERLRAAMDRHQWVRKFGGSLTYGKDRKPWVLTNDHPALAQGSEDEDYPDCFRDENGLRFTMTAVRHEFDGEMRAMAREAGVELQEAEAGNPKVIGRGHDSVITEVMLKQADGSTRHIRPRFIIDCSGQFALISRTMKTRNRLPRKILSSRYAYVTGIDWTLPNQMGFPREMPHIISVGTGWSWLAELRPGFFSVGVVTDDWSCGFEGWLDRISELRDIFRVQEAQRVDYLGNAAASDHHYIHPDYSYETAIRFGRNWTCAGDAAIFLDPLMSQGVSLALAFGRRAGQLAAHALIGEGDTDIMLKTLHDGYRKEVQILNHLVSIWYEEDDSPLIPRWQEETRRISRAYGRDIGQDHNALRWIANLENIHLLLDGGTEEDVLAHATEVRATDWDDVGASPPAPTPA